jgi:hypothetical protein
LEKLLEDLDKKYKKNRQKDILDMYETYLYINIIIKSSNDYESGKKSLKSNLNLKNNLNESLSDSYM